MPDLLEREGRWGNEGCTRQRAVPDTIGPQLCAACLFAKLGEPLHGSQR